MKWYEAFGITDPYYADDSSCIVHCDCRAILPCLSGIDSIVTDPPYELGFMGKSWDKTGIAYDLNVWQGCLNALIIWWSSTGVFRNTDISQDGLCD